MPTPGGSVVRVAEAGRAETIVDTATLNAAMRSGGSMPSNITLLDADGSILARTHVIARDESNRTTNNSLRGL